MDYIAFFNTGVAQRQLKLAELMFVGSYAFGKKHFLWHQKLLAHAQMILKRSNLSVLNSSHLHFSPQIQKYL